MSTTSTAWSRSRGDFSPAFSIASLKASRLGKPGQAVAQHLGAKRALRLDLDGAVDDAQQAALLRSVASCGKRRQLDPVELRGDAVAVAEIELAGDVVAVEEVPAAGRRSARSSGNRPRSSRARCRSTARRFDEAAVVGGDA